MWQVELFAPYVALGVGVCLYEARFAASAWRRPKLAAIAFALAYALTVGGACAATAYWEWRLDRFDLDRDGFFAGTNCDPATASAACEATPEQERVMARVTNDVGRNLAPLTGLLLAPISSATALALARPIAWLRVRARGARSAR
jgi:hypothetical protein